VKHVLSSSLSIATVLAVISPSLAQPAPTVPPGASTTPPRAYMGPSPRGWPRSERPAPSAYRHHPHHAGGTPRHHSKATRSTSSTADRLNHDELVRSQSPSSAEMGRMPVGDRARGGELGVVCRLVTHPCSPYPPLLRARNGALRQAPCVGPSP
jgi:hypothetical protein